MFALEPLAAAIRSGNEFPMGDGEMLIPIIRAIPALAVFFLGVILTSVGQDLPDSKDPAGMKRYEGSELIGYRAPRFDEYLLPLGPQRTLVHLPTKKASRWRAR